LRGVIVGIKKKSGNEEKEKEPDSIKFYSGYDELDYVDKNEILQKELREKNKQYTELQIEHDQLKVDFEALKKKMEAMATKPVKSVIDDSDDEVVEETKTAKSKKHKIIKAIECDE
jgi:hypothetical protein